MVSYRLAALDYARHQKRMAVAGLVAQQFGLGFGLVDGPQLVF